MLYRYTKELSEQEFYESQEKQDLAVHRLEIIGEASKRLSDNTININNNIPWKEMKGMRDILIHQYDNILLEIVWNTIKEEIPVIELEIKKVLIELENIISNP